MSLLFVALLTTIFYTPVSCTSLCQCLGCCFRKKRTENNALDAKKLHSVAPAHAKFKMNLNWDTTHISNQLSGSKSSRGSTIGSQLLSTTAQLQSNLGWGFYINSKGVLIEQYDYIESQGTVIQNDTLFNRIFDPNSFNFQQSAFWRSQFNIRRDSVTSKYRIIMTKDRRLILTVYKIRQLSADLYMISESQCQKRVKSSFSISDVDVVLNTKAKLGFETEYKWMEQFVWYYTNYVQNQNDTKEQWSIVQDNFLYFWDKKLLNNKVFDVNQNNVPLSTLNIDVLNSLHMLLNVTQEQFKISYTSSNRSVIMPDERFITRTIGGIMLGVGKALFTYNKSQIVSVDLAFDALRDKILLQLKITGNFKHTGYGIQFKSALKLLENQKSSCSTPTITDNQFEIYIMFESEILNFGPAANFKRICLLLRSQSKNTVLLDQSLAIVSSINAKIPENETRSISSGGNSDNYSEKSKVSSLSRIKTSSTGNSSFSNISALGSWVESISPSETLDSNFMNDSDELLISSHWVSNQTINVLVINHSAAKSIKLKRMLKRFGSNVHVALARNIIEAETFLSRKRLKWQLFIIEDMIDGSNIGEGREWLRNTYKRWNLESRSDSIYVTCMFLNKNTPKHADHEPFNWLTHPIVFGDLVDIWFDHGWMTQKTPSIP